MFHGLSSEHCCRALSCLVYLYPSVYSPYKGIANAKADSACSESVYQTCQNAVTEEKQTAYEAINMQLRPIVPIQVDENPEGA